MKLVTYRTAALLQDEPARTARLGVLDSNRVVSAAALTLEGPHTMAELLAEGPPALSRLQAAWLDRGPELLSADGVAADDLELLPPVERPGKIVAIGINYRSHAAEQDGQPPGSPVIFAKFPTALIGHRAEITWDPALTQAVDFEAELAVVIGRAARRVDVGQALEYVLGYTCLNDVSARDLQYADRQFVRAKSLDTFAPLGPAVVTADEVGDPQALSVRCLVNDEVMQSASTADMVFGVAQLVAFCSQAFTLEPGDVIATGTPAGVGWFREPKRMLRDGDEVVVEIERVGRLMNRCREERGG